MDSNEDGLRKLQTRQTWAQITIIGVILTSLITNLFYAAANNGAPINHYFPDSEITYNDALLLAYIAVGALSWVAVGMWIHRAHKNIHEAAYSGLEFTPGWAVGWFIIPIASLWKPFQAMRELWNASVGEAGNLSVPANGLLWTWWLSWLVVSVGTMGEWSETFTYLAMGAEIVSAVCLWKIISTITHEQKSLNVAAVFT